jgi:hypothetical protein
MLPSIPVYLKKFFRLELLYIFIVVTIVWILLPPILSLIGVSQQDIILTDATSEEQMKRLKNGLILEFGFYQLAYIVKLFFFLCLFLLPFNYILRISAAKSKTKLEIFKEILDGFIAGEFDEEKFKFYYLEQIRADEDILSNKQLEVLQALFTSSNGLQKPLLERVQELRMQLNTM